jgi:hypothetical protein
MFPCFIAKLSCLLKSPTVNEISPGSTSPVGLKEVGAFHNFLNSLIMLDKNLNRNDEVIDLQQASEKGHTPEKGKKYRYTVDGAEFISDTQTRIGRVILELAGKKPAEKYILRKKVKGNWITVGPDEVVDFTEPGLEKFKTLPNDQTEGENENSLKREFSLLEEDEEFLNGLQLSWEAAKLNNENWILVHGYPIPEGYNVSKTILAIRMTAGYPTSQLDMAYFYPALSRSDAQPINNLAVMQLDGKMFQQWSRHRTSQNPWREGIDNLSTHIPLADAWLLNEFIKRPHYAKSA